MQSEFPMSGTRPCRVLIEGNPGYGKTTLTLKMASDWAAKKIYIDKFHLVFLIPLRDFQVRISMLMSLININKIITVDLNRETCRVIFLMSFFRNTNRNKIEKTGGVI